MRADQEPWFMRGGGELGALIRAHDWSSSSLGPPSAWSQSLKTAVRIMLTSRQPIWIGWGKDLIYLYNDPYKSIIGGKHPWALGKPTRLVWQEIWPEIGPMLATAMRGDEGTYVEEQLLIMERHGYPEETYYTFSYSPIPNDNGEAGGIICANTDDTRRVIGERQTRLLRDLAAQSVAARTVADACERCAAALATNPRDLPFALIYLGDDGSGFRRAGASGIGPGHPAAVRRATRDDTPWPLAEAVASNEPQLVTTLASRIAQPLPSGSWHQPPYQAAVIPIPGSGERGSVGALVVGLNPFRRFDDSYRGFLSLTAGQIGTAIGHAVAYEEERRRAQALAEIDRAKTVFFSNISHEFRTPLTLMMGPIEEAIAEGDDLPPKLRQRLDMAHRKSLRLLRLVNSLLDFSRIEAGRVRALFQPTDLASLTSELASSFRAATEKAGLRLVVETPPLDHPVFVDQEMWEKIVLNLISNAFKFTFEGEIRVRLHTAGHMAVLVVSDTGIGIPAAELPKLFERFHRVEGAQGRSYEGSGIGLALVNELVRLHGGSITVVSEPGRGTSFTVEIPLGSNHLPAEQVLLDKTDNPPPSVRTAAFVQEALRWLPDQAEPGDAELESPFEIDRGRGGAPRHRVVLADDNADLRDYVARILREQGYAVEPVADGEAALAAVRRQKPDLLITDIMMPRLDGFGLIRAIRQDASLEDLSVIMLSARSGEEARVGGLDAGADDYLIKPFSARELIARVESRLSLARVRREATAALRESEARFRALATASSDVLYGMSPDWKQMRQLDGRGFLADTREVTDNWIDDYLFPEDQPQVLAAISDAVSRKGLFELEHRVRRVDGSVGWLLSRAIPILNDRGDIVEWFGMAADVTDRKIAENALRDETRFLDMLNKTGAAIAGELDLERLVQTVTDAGVELTGAQFGAFFYKVENDGAERYLLHTLAGADESAFAEFPMPRKTAVFAPTFEGTGIVRSDDITTDFRYGKNAPYRGMPKGHLPVRSYLAVPVVSRSEKVIGGLFFGHSEPGRFSERHERLMAGIAAQAAVAIDNARLYQAAQREIEQRTAAEAALQQLNEQLETRVVEEIEIRRKAEAALQQAQRMESLGQLTGGVAHDFNNLLQLISGNLQLLGKDMAGNEKAERRIQNALTGVTRGARLASQLLAFGRRQPLEPKVINIGRLVRGLDEMLRRALGEETEVETTISGGLWNTFADPGQIENALLNLAINARDAMNGVGKLTIEVGNAFLSDDYARIHPEVTPGQYVMLAVTDTGVGIPPEIMDKVFEPFFTTKPEGQGTGLGLSMVYGFARQSNGHVSIYSEIGQGTTVKLYLPRSQDAEDVLVDIDQQAPLGGIETILVVEDDEEVRTTAVELLSDLGYRVLKAADAASALAIVESGIPIDLLFTDVVMPGPMRSPELARKARERLPGIGVLFTSGYTENAIVHGGRLDEGVNLLPKPYTREALARKVRHVLATRYQPANAHAPATSLFAFSYNSAAVSTQNPPTGASAQKILLVEDEALIRLTAAEMLQDLGYEVLEAGSAQEARAALQTYSIDVLMTDVQLPDQSGIELAEHARAIHPAIGVVFATGRSELAGAGEAQTARSVLLQKPYETGDIERALAQLRGMTGGASTSI